VDPIDRELASFLCVEPSPEFRARVRARIASEPLPRSWYLQWRVAAAGVAAIAVAVALVLGRSDLTDEARKSMVRSPLPSTALAALPKAVPSPRSAAVVIHHTSSVSEPEVLVAPREARGLRQLEALVRDGRTHFVFSDDGVLAVSPAPVTDIVIAPIAIAPLETAAVSESGNAGGDEQ
jgi:hypothetical protein